MSEKHFDDAKLYIPGGVNSPVRAFNGVGGTPVFFSHGDGPYLYDTEGQIYIDYVGSWGPMIVGHAHPSIIQAVKVAAQNGLSFGAPTLIETEMAAKISQLMPSIEQVRMVNSGTEATMSAIRLARGFTGRDKIIKFEGCYHGHADSLLVKAGSGALTMGIPSSAGVPGDIAQHTLTCRYNDLENVKYVLEQEKDRIAAIIVEPVTGNMNCIPPKPGFLEGLRKLCNQHDTVLIFDEVMTGFRVHLGGAQALYKVKPDLTTLGKVIGAGLPVGAFGGRQDIMSHLAPTGPVYQAGTLSGNPVAMAAGLKMLELVSQEGFYEMLGAITEQLVEGLKDRANHFNIPMTVHSVGGMFGIFFSNDSDVYSFEQVNKCNLNQFKQFFHGMLHEGIYLAPSAFEAGFVSATHDDGVIQATLRKAEKVLKKL